MNRFRSIIAAGHRCLRLWLLGLSVGAALLLSPQVQGQTPPSMTRVCDRTGVVVTELLALVRAAADDASLECGAVTATHLAGITSLALNQSGLRTLTADDFDGLTSLTTLSLYGNELTATGLPTGVFGGLSSLQTLVLDNNLLETLPANLFSGLSNLQELRLANNRLTTAGLPTGVFDGLSSLRVLTLNGNGLSSLPAVFSGLSALETLHLYGNRLTQVGTQLQNLSNLEWLTLYDNSISSINAGAFTGLSSLQFLNLYGNGLSSLPAAVFSGLTALEQLNLSDNSLGSSLPAGLFSGLTALQVLLLNDNLLTSLPASPFAGLTALQRLNLGYNQLASLPASPFAGLTALQDLYLDHNSLTGLVGNLFQDLTGLRRLRLNHNPRFPSDTIPDDFLVGPTGLVELDLRCGGSTAASSACSGRILSIPLELVVETVSGTVSALLQAPTGAPFAISADLRLNNSSVGSVTIPAGSTRGTMVDFPVPTTISTCVNWAAARTTSSFSTVAFRGLSLGQAGRHSFAGGGALDLADVADREAPVDQLLTINLPAATGGFCDDSPGGMAMGGLSDVTYSLRATTTHGTLANNLPAGLAFSPISSNDDPVLTGTPRVAGTYNLTYSVVDSSGAGDTATRQFALKVTPNLSFGTPPANQTYQASSEISELVLPELNGAVGDATYSLTATTRNGMLDGELPDGLSFVADSRTLSGTPTASGDYSMTYSATDSDANSLTAIFTIIVRGGFAAVVDKQAYLVGDTLSLVLPEYVDSTVTGLTYNLLAVTNDGVLTPGVTVPDQPGFLLPDGLVFNAETRTLSGTPTAAGTYDMVYYANYCTSPTVCPSSNSSFTIDVFGFPAEAPSDQGYVTDQAIDPLVLPEAIGETGMPFYSLTATASDGGMLGTNSLPAGLAFEAGTRTLSGTPTAAGTYSMAFNATDIGGATGNVTATFTILVGAAPNFSVMALPDLNWVVDKQIAAPVQLPVATGGLGALSYSLTQVSTSGGISTLGVPGLQFAGDSRTLSGTPTAVGRYQLLYEVFDPFGNRASLDFEVQIHARPSFGGATFDDRVYIVDRAIPSPSSSDSRRLVFEEATGGLGDLTYSLTATIEGDSSGSLNAQNLPAGLEFDAGTLAVSGTPTATGVYRMTLTVTDEDDNSAMLQFYLTVRPALFWSATQGELEYAAGSEVDLLLPEASGGITPLTYRLTATIAGDDGTLNTDNLPDGLAFDAASRELTGTPTTAGTYRMTYSATDGIDDMVSDTFALQVSPVLMVTATDQAAVVGGSVNLELPEAVDAIGDATYSLTATIAGDDGTLNTDNLPDGLAFDAASRELTGTPTTAGTYRMTYSATDEAPNTAEAEFDLVVHPALALAAVSGRDWLMGVEIAALELPQAAGGIPPLTYDLTATIAGDGSGSLNAQNLPDGLAFDAASRELTGTPTAAGTYALTWSVTDAQNNSAEQGFNAVVHPALMLNSRGDRQYLVDAQIMALQLPEAAGGIPPLTYGLTATIEGDGSGSLNAQNLPDGLAFDDARRELSGTPTAVGTYSMVYSVASAGSSTTASFDLVVRPALSFASTPVEQGYLVNQVVAALVLPQATGGVGDLTYSLTATIEGDGSGSLVNNLPAGLSFDAANHRLSGSPTAVGRYSLTHRVTDMAGNYAEQTFVLVVWPTLSFPSGPDSREYQAGSAIEDLVLPAATGGIRTLTYRLEASTDDGTLVGDLPAGLSFDAARRALSGTPTAEGSYSLTWIAIDDEGNSTRLSFRIRVLQDRAPTFAADARVEDHNWLVGTEIGELVLPPAEGGNGVLVYGLEATTDDGTLTDGLPAGLEFAADSRTLSGTPTAAGTYRMAFSATDTDGDRAQLQFSLRILAAEQVEAMADGEIRQSSALALAASVGHSMAHRLETFAAGDLLTTSVDPGGSSLSLPLAVSGAEGATEQGGGLAFWLQSGQQQLENRNGLLAWDGEVEETRFGLDGKIGRNLLLGLMASRSEGIFDYDGVGGALQGRYQSELELMGPYLGWTGDNGLNLWAMLSSGEGRIGAPDEDSEQFDLSMGLLGLDYQLLSNRVSEFRVRAELSSLDLEYGSADRLDNADLLEDATVSETWQLRLVAETSHHFRTSGGASWTPSWQLAFRDNNNAQALSAGLEFGGSLGYRSARGRFRFEVGARMLDAESEGYKESGSYLLLRLQTSADKRGLSFSLQPKRGQTASRAEDLWDRRPDALLAQSLAAVEDANDAEQTVGELGYGIAWGARFLLTPYSKLSWSQNNRRWALGTRWQTGQHFSLSLESHGQTSGHSDPSHGIRLQGRLNF